MITAITRPQDAGVIRIRMRCENDKSDKLRRLYCSTGLLGISFYCMLAGGDCWWVLLTCRGVCWWLVAAHDLY